MAFCTNCGHKLSENAKFCPECGKRNEWIKSQAEERKNVYDGEIHKCPNCGEQLDSFETVCPCCGYELRGTKAPNSVDVLIDKLEKAESNEKKEDLIRNFYVPNTKEDIYEFAILASSNILSGDDESEAWYAKLEQAYQKAKISFGDSSEFRYINQLYINSKKQQNTKVLTSKLKKSKYFRYILLCAFGVLIMIIGAIGLLFTGESLKDPFIIIVLFGFLMAINGFVFAICDEEESQ